GRSDAAGARSRARELILQALYQKHMTGYDSAELLQQFRSRDGYRRADRAYFDDSLAAICDTQSELEREIEALADRPLSQLDPVEMAILLLGFFELSTRPDIPYRVVINESVNLAKRFGAVDGHKYINALLDKAADKLRPAEVSGGG
ncbi:MAG: transcription antitermination factor NusB, partial [Woeseia sp.]